MPSGFIKEGKVCIENTLKTRPLAGTLLAMLIIDFNLAWFQMDSCIWILIFLWGLLKFFFSSFVFTTQSRELVLPKKQQLNVCRISACKVVWNFWKQDVALNGKSFLCHIIDWSSYNLSSSLFSNSFTSESFFHFLLMLPFQVVQTFFLAHSSDLYYLQILIFPAFILLFALSSLLHVGLFVDLAAVIFHTIWLGCVANKLPELQRFMIPF